MSPIVDTHEGWASIRIPKEVQLPPEIWRVVFDHAVNTYPIPLTTQITSPLVSVSQPDFRGADLKRRLLSASMATKRNLSLVCKSWRSIACEFLFHTIQVTSQRTIPLLWYALCEDAHRRPNAQGPEALTWWIRRIWVEDLGPMSWYILASDQLPEWSVLELVRRCPRLVEFTGPGLLKPVKKIDFSPFQRTLNAICGREMPISSEPRSKLPIAGEVDSGGLSLTFILSGADDMNKLVSGHSDTPIDLSSIRALHLHGTGSVGNDLDTTPVLLPSLQLLEVRGNLAIQQACTFIAPSLRAITYNYIDGNDNLEPLLSRLGGELEELEIVGSPAFSEGYLERTCPKLRTLVIDNLHQFALPNSDVIHSAVTTICVAELYLGSEVTRAGMAARIQRLQWAFPTARTIRATSWREQAVRQRAVSSSLFPDRRYCAFWMCLAEVAESVGLRLLDWKGSPIAGFQTWERCRRDWNPHLEDMLAATFADEEQTGNESE